MASIKKTISGLAAISIATLAAATVPAKSQILDLLIQQKTFPYCDDAKVLAKIVKKFNWAENRTWQRGFTMDGIERARERVEQGTHISSIPRRYCRGHALLSNGKHPTVYYLIEGGQGFAGNGFNVEYCISGLDNWNEFDGSCRAIRY